MVLLVHVGYKIEYSYSSSVDSTYVSLYLDAGQHQSHIIINWCCSICIQIFVPKTRYEYLMYSYRSTRTHQENRGNLNRTEYVSPMVNPMADNRGVFLS